MSDLDVKRILVEESMKKSNMSGAFDIVANQSMVFFRSVQEYKGNRVLLGIILDDSAYTTVTVFFGKLVDESKKEQVVQLVNELNGLHNIEKFVLNKNNELLVQLPYISLSTDFNGDVVVDLLRTLYGILIKNAYSKFEDILGESMYNKL